MISKWVFVSLASFFCWRRIVLFRFQYMFVSFLQEEIIWKRRCMYLTWIELQLWILWMTSSVKRGWFRFPCRLWSCSNRHERGFFSSFYLEAHNLGTLQALQIKILLGSSGCILISPVIWHDFLAHQKNPLGRSTSGRCVLGYASGIRSALVPMRGKWYRLKGGWQLVTLWPGLGG